jgi:hypothetical protein
MLPVLDGDVEAVPSPVEVGDDRVPAPIAIRVDDVAPVTFGEQIWIKARIIRPRLWMRADADLPG